jgi:prepilin-type N-terminal cleavage/methylation domain-containing protein
MKRPEAGFTIVEVLIVVLILTIVAVIAVPRFTGATDDTRENRLAVDIKTVRQAIERYRLHHHANRGPHLDESGALDMENFQERLLGKTDADGKVNPDGEHGPYLMEWPTNPFVPNNVAGDITVGATLVPKRNGQTGWYYDVNSCTFSANSTVGALDTDPVAEDVSAIPHQMFSTD